MDCNGFDILIHLEKQILLRPEEYSLPPNPPPVGGGGFGGGEYSSGATQLNPSE